MEEKPLRKGERIQVKVGIMHLCCQTSQYSNSLVDIIKLWEVLKFNPLVGKKTSFLFYSYYETHRIKNWNKLEEL